MKLIAIASMQEKKELKRIRVYDFDNCKTRDILITSLYRYNIRNIQYEKGNVVWKEGSISRYPMISLDSMEIQNKDTVTVIGRYKLKDNYTYVTVNVLGEIKEVNEEKLIDLTRKNELSNYKLLTRNGKIYTSAIGKRTIDLNLLEPRFKLKTKTLYINMYYNQRTKIDIPNRDYKGMDLNSFNNIIVKNCNLDSIKYIKIPNCYIGVKYNSLKQFKNLETIEFNGPNITIDSDEMNKSNVKKVIVDSINETSRNALMNCTNITDIEYIKKPSILYDNMYTNCSSLNCNNLIYEGIKVLDVGVFKGCKLESLVVPHSVRVLDLTEIEDTNINSIELKRTDIYIQNLSKVCINRIITITVPGSFPIDDIQRENINIVVKEKTQEELSNKGKLKKASTLGLRISNRAARTPNEIKAVLTLIDDTKFRGSLIDVVKIPSIIARHLEFTVGYNEMLINITFIYKLNKIEICAYYTLNNYIVVSGKSLCYIYTLNKNRILDNIIELASYDGYSGKLRVYLPSDVVYIKEEDIHEIYEENEILYITDVKGRKVQVTI